MKILFMSEFYPPYYKGGYEINCEVTLKGLEQRGHSCVVLTSNYGSNKPIKEEKIYRLMYPLISESSNRVSARVNQLRNACLGRKNYLIAKQVLDEVQPDIAYIWRMGNVSIFPINAVHDRKIPAVYELGDYWLINYKRDFVLEPNNFKRIYRKALFGGHKFHSLDFSNIIVISETLKRHYVEHNFNSDYITVIHRSVPEALICKRMTDRVIRNGDVIKLLYAGRVVEEKGVHIAVQGIDRLVNLLGIKNICLDIVGNGSDDYVMKLEKFIESKRLQGVIKFKGQIPRHELMRKYTDYDALLFPSIWDEPFGMTIIEAMSVGLPVIASRVGAAPEIINDGENGLLVTPSDPSELAEAVRRFLEDPLLRAKIRTTGIKTCAERFSNNKIIEQIEKYLLQITF